MEKIKVSNGIYWIEVPEIDLYILCGCPMDSVKHLKKRGLIRSIEKNGKTFETGPNAILLSDVSIQHGYFCNLAEFPVLQMMYNQGMTIPNHPGNTGRIPMLIGIEEQVKAQSRYIYRGNYGLVSEQEIIDTGTDPEMARDMMRLKMNFAFDNIRTTDQLLDLKIVDKDVLEIRDNFYIHRQDVNRYEFIYNNESVTVDLNLDSSEKYEPPYKLGFHSVKPEYFSVIHIGEGNGWDQNRPCMGSILNYRGKYYLIDAGPGILNTLTAMGISVNEIEGIFHTHAHDDHFAGLTSLVRSDHKIKYYATPLVRSSVVKKLCSLMSIDEQMFEMSFEVHDLTFDVWNNIEGLEVMPCFSPHPLETSVLFFRTYWMDGFKSYAHFADIVSRRVHEKMITDDETKSGVSQESFDKVWEMYLREVDIKKLDVGEGMIHGDPRDFIDDKSKRIILSHTSDDLKDYQKEIGSNATFGMQDVLISTRLDYDQLKARFYLNSHFPDVPPNEIDRLMNCKIRRINAGTMLIKKGSIPDYVLLIISGVVEYINAERGINNILSASSMVGEMTALTELPARATYRAASYINVLEIPTDLYRHFILGNKMYDDLRLLHDYREFLQETYLLGSMVSYQKQNRIARAIRNRHFSKGESVEALREPGIYLLRKGEIILLYNDRVVETIEPGGFFGEESVLFDESVKFSAQVIVDSEIYFIPSVLLEDIPIIQWKLLESYRKRLKVMGSQVKMQWRQEYSVGVQVLDEQHQKLFKMVNVLYLTESQHEKSVFEKDVDLFIKYLKFHFITEEKHLKESNYSDYQNQYRAHRMVVSELQVHRNNMSSDVPGSSLEFLDCVKEWLIKHTLGEDKKYSSTNQVF